MAQMAVAAAWSVLISLFVQTAFAASLTSPQVLVLDNADSIVLMNRLNMQLSAENYRGTQLITKRFSSADGAFRIDCAQPLPDRDKVMCAITLDPAKTKTGMTSINRGVTANTLVFEMRNKTDVENVYQKFIGDKGPIFSTEMVNLKTANNQISSVSRYRLDCPKDWVFDVVSCSGYIILRDF